MRQGVPRHADRLGQWPEGPGGRSNSLGRMHRSWVRYQRRTKEGLDEETCARSCARPARHAVGPGWRDQRAIRTAQPVPSGEGARGRRRAERPRRRVGSLARRARDGAACVGARRYRRREHLGRDPLRRNQPAPARPGRTVRRRLPDAGEQAQGHRYRLQVQREGRRRAQLRPGHVHLAAWAPRRSGRQRLGHRRGQRPGGGDGRQGRREGRPSGLQVQPGRDAPDDVGRGGRGRQRRATLPVAEWRGGRQER